MLDAKVWLDINLVGTGTYVNNDLVYLEDQKWIPIVRDAIREESRLTEDDIKYDQGHNRYHAYNRNFVHALSGVWSQGDHAAGLSISGRSYTAVRKVPDYVAYFIEHGVPPYTPQHDIEYSLRNVKAASLNFAEIKGSYAYTFLKRRQDMFMGGITISKFFSLAGAGANIYDFNFEVDNDSLAILYHLESDLMYTPEVVFNARGGWGLDLGFTYQKMLGEAGSYFPNSPQLSCRSNPYKYKLGISIIDIGSVKFAEENILFAGYNFNDYYWLNYPDDEIDEDNVVNIYEEIEQDITNGQVKKQNKVRLPTFVSAQFDYNLYASRLYLNGTLIQGIPVPKYKFGLRHANSLSVTPRYETFMFEFALPISLYEYRYPQLGAAIRLGPITIGSDKLISWIKNTNLFGADLYFHLKLPFRYHPKCKGKGDKTKFKNGEKHKKYRPCEAYG
jgi:hypothetical protein